MTNFKVTSLLPFSSMFVWFFRFDFGGLLCDDVQLLMLILKPKSSIFVGFNIFEAVGG